MPEATNTPEQVKPHQPKHEQNPSLFSELKRLRQYEEKLKKEGMADHGWFAYGSDISSYQKWFDRVLQGNTIVGFIDRKPSPIVIDLMSPSDTLASLFEKLPGDKPKFGLALSLGDRRDLRQKERDDRLNIEQIAGDITQPSTWKEIQSRLHGRNADLIMERAGAGLNSIPDNKKLYSILINKAWRLLSDQVGMLLAEVTYEENDRHRIKEWTEFLKGKGINAVYDVTKDTTKSTSTIPLIYACIKLMKTPDSLKDLPFLK